MYNSRRFIRPVLRLTRWRCSSSAGGGGAVVLSEEVREALSAGRALVALESAILTHGLPHPHNLRCALGVERIVRENGAVPATIGILGGIAHVGLNSEQMEALASEQTAKVKVSKRDLPYVLAAQVCGGTTVSASLAVARRAGIPILVTGGIGGVHRGAHTSMDVSADLPELGRLPMTVVCAGVKSILDVEKTLEYLETLGVCVSTFGPSREFPCFFTARSGCRAPCNVRSTEEAVGLIEARDRLGLESSVLIAVPIPAEHEPDGEKTEAIIREALRAAEMQAVKGKDVTPFVLDRVHRLSEGASLRANMALIENNARVGSRIAVKLASIREEPRVRTPRPVVIGASVLDIHVTSHQDIRLDGRTVEGRVEWTAGGVGRNVADCLTRLGHRPLFVSALGRDDTGDALARRMRHMETCGVERVRGERSACCCVSVDRGGECAFVVGDLRVLERLDARHVERHARALAGAPLVVMDGNLGPPAMDRVMQLCARHRVPVWFEPTDVSKASRPFLDCTAPWSECLHYASPNARELRVMHDALAAPRQPRPQEEEEEGVWASVALCRPLLRGTLRTLVVTLGAQGLLLVTRQHDGAPLRAAHHPAPPLPRGALVSVSGAGDCLAGALVAALLEGRGPPEWPGASEGLRAAALSLRSAHAVPDSLSPEAVQQQEAAPPPPTVRYFHS